MTLQDLLEYVRRNARDVSDLATAHKIEVLPKDDPWRKTLIRDIRKKYQDEAISTDRDSVFEESEPAR